MKKVLVMILAILLCACDSFTLQEKEEYLYKLVDNTSVNTIDVTSPSEVEIFDNTLGCGYSIDSTKIISNIVSLFTQIKTVKEIQEFSDTGTFDITFRFVSDEYSISFYNKIVEVNKADKTYYYEVENVGGLSKYVHDLIAQNFGLDVQYVTIFDYEGVSAVQGACNAYDNGDYAVEIELNNTTDKSYAVMMDDLFVNGYNIHTYQQLIIAPENQIGYTCTVQSSLLKQFGIETISDITYVLKLYEYDEEKHIDTDLVYSSDVMNITLTDRVEEEFQLENPIYDDGDFEIYALLKEEDINTNMIFLFVNNTDEDVAITFDKIQFNEEDMILTDASRVYSASLGSGLKSFALYPLYNYDYNSETYETKKIDIEKLIVNIAFSSYSYNYKTGNITLR